MAAWGKRISVTLALSVAVITWECSAGTPVPIEAGANPHPVQLRRPPQAALSATAILGKQIFYDHNLSASGSMTCASCHDPAHAYGPPDGASARLGGVDGETQGNRAVPGLRYAFHTPNFSIGPDIDEAGALNPNQAASRSAGLVRVPKTAGSTASAVAMVPQGGLFWDGRVNTLQLQAVGPLLNPVEMANPDIATVAAKLSRAPYAYSFVQVFGAGILQKPTLLVEEAMFAVARFQVEDVSFNPYTSKYDYWLEGKADLSPAESRGLKLFDDKDKANCAGCHIDKPGTDGQPPLFTDFQYEALGVPRNPVLKVNTDPAYHDLGLCGPIRHDIATQTQYCGMFRTPSLRNAATRKVFFHNGVYHSLEDVLAFYDFRDVRPDKIYPKGPDGKPLKFDDIPKAYLANMDATDPPFDRKPGQAPAMTDQDMRDIIAFLGTLTDGYQPQASPAVR
ncbi:MAG TPA: cytochrome c peroxidase [Gammaproteobacteria bacterium]|jgi:cytochrome c peroxidase